MKADTVLFTYTGKQPELSEEDAATGKSPPIPEHHPGVPLRNITVADAEEMPAHTLATVEGSHLYDVTESGKRFLREQRRAQEAASAEAQAPAQVAEEPASGARVAPETKAG